MHSDRRLIKLHSLFSHSLSLLLLHANLCAILNMKINRKRGEMNKKSWRGGGRWNIHNNLFNSLLFALCLKQIEIFMVNGTKTAKIIQEICHQLEIWTATQTAPKKFSWIHTEGVNLIWIFNFNACQSSPKQIYSVTFLNPSCS